MRTSKLAVYGILKRGFSLDLSKPEYGGKFLDDGIIQSAQLHAISYGVGLRFVEDPLQVAHVELFEIPDELWDWLDQIESNGRVYTRKVVQVHVEDLYKGYDLTTNAWVYEHMFLNTQEEYDKYYPKIESGRYEMRGAYD